MQSSHSPLQTKLDLSILPTSPTSKSDYSTPSTQSEMMLSYKSFVTVSRISSKIGSYWGILTIFSSRISRLDYHPVFMVKTQSGYRIRVKFRRVFQKVLRHPG